MLHNLKKILSSNYLFKLLIFLIIFVSISVYFVHFGYLIAKLITNLIFIMGELWEKIEDNITKYKFFKRLEIQIIKNKNFE